MSEQALSSPSRALLSRTELEQAPRRNAQELLKQAPGLTLIQHGSEGKGHQLFLRGFDASHGADLAVTLYGVPLNEWSSVHAQGYLDLSLILPELVSHIEVLKGPFRLSQGLFAMAGEARYHLSAPLNTEARRVAYTVGSALSEGGEGVLLNRHRLFGAYTPPQALGDEVWAVALTRDSGFGERRALERVVFNNKLRLSFPQALTHIELTTLGTLSRFELPSPLRLSDINAERVGPYDSYDHALRGEASRVMSLALIKRTRRLDRFNLTAHLSARSLWLRENFTGFVTHPQEGDRREQAHKSLGAGVRASYERALSSQLTLQTLIGISGEHIDQQETLVAQDLSTLEERRALAGLQLASHLGATLRWRLAPTLVAEGGGRFDAIKVSLEGEGSAPLLLVPSPRLSLRWRPTPSTSLSTSYGRGMRPPEARAFSGFKPSMLGGGMEQLASASPAMTTSDAFEVGGALKVSPRVSVSAAGFLTLIERESIFDHLSGLNLELNGTRRFGGELGVSAQLSGGLSARAEVSYVHARFVGSGNPIPFAPWLTSALHTRYQRGPYTLGARLIGVAPRDLPHGAVGSALLMSDLTARYHKGPLSLALEVENPLALTQYEGVYYYQSHWQPQAPAALLPSLNVSPAPPLNVRFTLELGW
jgi:outer membrane receptor protein involved in Fe transport